MSEFDENESIIARRQREMTVEELTADAEQDHQQAQSDDGSQKTEIIRC